MTLDHVHGVTWTKASHGLWMSGCLVIVVGLDRGHEELCQVVHLYEPLVALEATVQNSSFISTSRSEESKLQEYAVHVPLVRRVHNRRYRGWPLTSTPTDYAPPSPAPST